MHQRHWERVVEEQRKQISALKFHLRRMTDAYYIMSDRTRDSLIDEAEEVMNAD